MIFIFNSNIKAQYSETFSTANRGYLLNCVNDFSGLNWTLSPWSVGGTCQPANLRDSSDYFRTNGGVLESSDLDEEVYWESPEMNISAAGTVSLAVDLTWASFDVDAAGNNCIGDFIRVQYSINGGAYLMVPNQAGGNPCATIAYPLGSTPPTNASLTVTRGGISGNTLKIRVVVFTNTTADVVTIDNVSVPQAGVTIGCAAALIGTSATQAGSCNSANGSITVTATGATPPYNVAWSGPSSGNPGGTEITSSGGSYTITPLATGSYTISVTDAASCVSTSLVSVTTAAALTPTTQVLNVSCPGFTDGEIDLIVAGGVPPFTYSWSNLPGAGDPQDQINLATGTYNVTVNDNAGCSANTSATIGTQVLAAYNEQFNVANKGYLANFVDDFVGVNWTMSSWANQPPASFGRDNNDFFRTSGGALVGDDLDQEVCWTSPVIDLNTGTMFSVDLGWTGFDNEDYINLNYSIDGGAFVSIPTVCCGGSIGTINYPLPTLDQNGSTTVTKTGLSGSTIQVQVCGNFNSETMTIDNVSVPNSLNAVCPSCTMTASITNNTPATCNGGSSGSLTVTASNGTQPYTYLWSNGATTSNITSLLAGTYTVTVSDGAGCTASTSAVVTQPSAIILSTVVTNVACNGGNNGAINLTVSGGTSPFTYDWSNDGPEMTDNDLEDLSGLTAGTYIVTITDANGCTSSTSALVTEPTALILTTSETNVTCNGGSNGTIDLSVSGGTAPYSYDWTNDGPEFPDNDTQDLTGLTAGNYSVTVTDANGCSSTTSSLITEPLTATYTFIGPGSDFNVSTNWQGGCIPPMNTPGTEITINSGQTLNLIGNLTATIINNGTLTGSLNLNGDITNNETVSPGN